MRSSPITTIVSMAGIVLALLALYFGSLLPLTKAQSYIAAEHGMSSVRTLDDFLTNYDMALDLYSPVGDEETAKFLGGKILNIVAQGQSEDVSRELVRYIEEHLFDDDVRHLMLQGQMYQVLWENYEQEEDYQKAVDYFELTHEIGPDLPPPLYSLFKLYGLKEDMENFERTGRLILERWPQDEKVSELLK